jgi:hypothetical protein
LAKRRTEQRPLGQAVAMGEQIVGRTFTREDRQRYRDKVHRCLDVFARMLREERFEFEEPLTGMEVELNLVEQDGQPALRNSEVLERIDDPAFVQELGRFNLEINVPPKNLGGDGAMQYEFEVRDQLNAANEKAAEVHAGMVMIGILPTLTPELMTHESISSNPRYALLDEQMLLARGEDLQIDIRGGPEYLETYADSIAPEAACTSVQFHLQVSPDEFAQNWNAAQCLAAAQVGLGANSPYFLGRELWRETRISLFTQATDTRPAELKAQGVRPRVWFGERWITSVFDLFEENITYFPALLPVIDDEDPVAELDAGRTPALHELRLHNGTVWRWNRPVYDVVNGTPHLRVENRVLPAGPTVVDIMANGALYFGALRALAEQERPVWSQMSFDAAEENFLTAAQRGLDAVVYWPSTGEISVAELTLRKLLPLAHEGLRAWGVDDDIRERLLGVIEGRCTTGRNGATWQVQSVHAFQRSGMPRWEALRRMTQEYVARMHTNEPVHTWDPV